MLSRRDFLSRSALAAGFVSLSGLASKLHASKEYNRVKHLSATDAASDEDFWAQVRQSYTVSHEINYLNNAGMSPQAAQVQKAQDENLRFSNQGPSYYMWHVLDKNREPLRNKLATLSGCSPDEIAINRNATEGLNTIIFGLNLKAGDEVVLSKYDYPGMRDAWMQRQKREGIKLVWIEEFEFPLEDDQKIVDMYARVITPNTKIVHITHLINYTGQIVPVRKIADMAHSKGCEVIVDGAQSFAMLNFKIPDLGCDYFATSLHKWLCAPFGTGMMYIKKDKIKNVWALLSAPEPDGENIRKFESIGTHSYATEMTIADAIDFHLTIGIERKEARLRYLKDHWYNKIKDIPKVKLYTSFKPEYACALATFTIEGLKGSNIYEKLFDDYKIYGSPMDYEGLKGIRISPNVFTSLDELDSLVSAIKQIASN
jgi:selenocysteine lyase/cysteine desulfurase